MITEILVGIAIVALGVVVVCGQKALVKLSTIAMRSSDEQLKDVLQAADRRARDDNAHMMRLVEKASLRPEQAASIHAQERVGQDVRATTLQKEPLTHAEAQAKLEREDDEGVETTDASLAAGT